MDAQELQRLREIAHLIGSIYFYGDFKAETRNEVELQKRLGQAGCFYQSEDEVIQGAVKIDKTAERAVSPAENVDTPELRGLLERWFLADDTLEAERIAHAAIIAHIDASRAAAHAEGRRSAMEELAKEKERVDRAEHKVAELRVRAQEAEAHVRLLSSTAQAEPAKPNADCNGDPANCPDNEGYGCACDPMNKAATATDVVEEHPLEIYADSYERMSAQGCTAVHPISVATDIRNNMMPITIAASPAKATPEGADLPPLDFDERAAFEDFAKDRFMATEYSFARAHGHGYYNTISSDTFDGRRQPAYADVQMLWDAWEARAAIARRRAAPPQQVE